MARQPQIAFTNLEQSARSGIFRCLVPWSTGDISSLAVLQTGKMVEFNGSTINTKWSTFGPTHRDGSVRWSVAEFQATIPAEVQQPTAPTVIATVVDGPNVEPTADFTEFDAYWATQEVAVSYTDSRNNQTYTLDLLSVARAGTNNATYTETEVGLRKEIFAEAYMGRGRHHELERASGFNTNSAVNETQGNLHVKLWFVVNSGERHGHGTIQFVADSQYPYPAEPPDGGARQSSDPGRPTRLDPAVGEALEEPLVFEFSNLQVGFTNSASTNPAYTQTRLWFTRNADQGIGPYGQHPIIDIPTRQTFNIGLGALGDMQGWSCKFTTAWETQSQATWTEAWELARRPYTYLGIPTHDTWMDTKKTGAMPAPYASDEMEVKGGADIPLLEVPQALLDQWYAEGFSRYTNFMLYTPPTRFGRLWEWDLLGRKVAPSGSGSAPQLGMFRQGRTWLANSIWDVYRDAAWVTRELGGARVGMLWKQEDHPSLYDGLNLNASVFFSGTEFVTSSRDCKGRLKDYGGNRSHENYIAGGNLVIGSGAEYNGTTSENVNPDFKRLTPFQQLGEIWENWDHAHFGMFGAVHHYLLTHDPFVLDMIENTASIISFRMTPTHYFGKNPSDATTRAEARSSLRSNYHAWLVTGKSKYPTLVANRLNQYTTGGTNNSSNPHRWDRWPIFNDDIVATDMLQCDGARANRVFQGPGFSPWQSSHWSVYAAMLCLEWSDLHPTEMAIAAECIRMQIRTIAEQCFMAAPNVLSSAATRPIDNCWNNVLTVRAGNTGEINALLRAGFGCGRFYRTFPSDTTPYTLQTDISNITQLLLPSNGSENQDNYPAFRLYDIFADFRADAELTERCEYFLDRMRVFYPVKLAPEGYDDDGSKGYASDSWRPSGTFPAPAPSFVGVPRQGDQPLTVNFDSTGSAVGGDRSAALFRWWFEYDGSAPIADFEGTPASTPTIEQPSHTYTAAGSFRVKLEITDSAGQTTDLDVRDYIITTGSPPTADFYADPTTGFDPEQVSFIDRSTDNPTSWAWTVRDTDGNTILTSTDQDWVGTLTEGTYDVELVVSNTYGSATALRQSYIVIAERPNPVAFFTATPSQGVIPPTLTVTFDNQSTNAGRYYWDFDDGTTSEEAEPGTHEFTTQGVFWVELTAFPFGDATDGASTYRYPISVISGSGVPVVGVDIQQPVSMLCASLTLYDPTPSGVTTGQEVKLEDVVTASVTQYDPTVEINKSASPDADFVSASVTQYDPTLDITTDVTADFVSASVTTYSPTPTVDVQIVQVDVGPPITVDVTPYSVTATPGISHTEPVEFLSSEVAVYDAVGQVVVDKDIELGFIGVTSNAYTPTVGAAINRNVFVTLPTASATVYDAAGSAHGVGASYIEATFVVYDAFASGDNAKLKDEVWVTGSLEAPTELEGSV